MQDSFKTRYRSYKEPWDPVRYGIWAIWEAAKEALRSGAYGKLFSYTHLTDAGSYLWFKTLNTNFTRFEQTTPLPTLIPTCTGKTLELGPGLGNQLSRYDKSKITQIIGVESNPNYVPHIRQQIRDQGLEGLYELVVAGVQESDVLEKHGVVRGGLDTVLSVQVLCSVSDARALMREVYGLLKPGGRFIFWEHHRSSDWVTAVMQYLWNPIWKPLVGGCNLNRDIKAAILEAGEWENLESLGSDETPWGMMPRVWGELVKPKNE